MMIIVTMMILVYHGNNTEQTNVQHYHYEDKTGWGPARDRCLENKGDLVVVNSEQENM